MMSVRPSMTKISVGVFVNSDNGILLTRSALDQHWNIPTQVVEPGMSIIETANQLLDTLGLEVEIHSLLTMEWWSHHPDQPCSELWLIYNCDWLEQDRASGLTPSSTLRFTLAEDLPGVTTRRLDRVLLMSTSDHLSRPVVLFENGRTIHPSWASRIGPEFGRDI